MGNGERINAWRDCWVDHKIVLIKHIWSNDHVFMNEKVNDLVTENGDWDWVTLSLLFQQEMLENLLLLSPIVLS